MSVATTHAPVISRAGGSVTVRVMQTNEELMIARHVQRLIVRKGADFVPVCPRHFQRGRHERINLSPVRTTAVHGPLSEELLQRIQQYWQAANYLTIGQIYLQDNPLLREPLQVQHIKPRLLGHWGTSPGLSFIYVHLNRLITERDAQVIYLAGPGHGGPAILATVYLEGTYSEVYPDVSDLAGMRLLFRRFSTPGGVPSHVSVPTPGSIHEGGELGYVLTHAFGAAFDNPDLIVAAVVGDGEAETGPLEVLEERTLPQSCARRGGVTDPASQRVQDRESDRARPHQRRRRARDAHGHGYDVFFVEGDDPAAMHQAFAATLDTCYERIRDIQRDARENGVSDRVRWPAIVLRTPEGWTGPQAVHGVPVEGTFRAHQVPLSDVRTDPDQLKQLESWLRGYQPEALFDETGRLVPAFAALSPKGDLRMGANLHANGGTLAVDLDLPDFREYALAVEQPAVVRAESTRRLAEMLRDVFTRNAAQSNFRIYSPDEANSNRLGPVFDVENRCFVGKQIPGDEHLSPDGRVMEVLSEHLCEGWLEGYILTGRHGLYVTYEAFAMVSASMTVQHTKWLEEAVNLPWRDPIPSLNILLTSTCWRNDHNGFSHQGPGLIDVMLSKRGTVARIYLPPTPTACCRWRTTASAAATTSTLS